MPQRIRLRRSKGWRKPEGAVVVARPSKWGNPWRVGDPHPMTGRTMSVADTVDLYRAALERRDLEFCTEGFEDELRGRDLACWCPLDQPCHGDVLLDVVNRSAQRS